MRLLLLLLFRHAFTLLKIGHITVNLQGDITIRLRLTASLAQNLLAAHGTNRHVTHRRIRTDVLSDAGRLADGVAQFVPEHAGGVGFGHVGAGGACVEEFLGGFVFAWIEKVGAVVWLSMNVWLRAKKEGCLVLPFSAKSEADLDLLVAADLVHVFGCHVSRVVKCACDRRERSRVILVDFAEESRYPP